MTPERRILSINRPSRQRLALAVGVQTLAAMCVMAQMWLLASVVGGVFLRSQRLGDVTPLIGIIVALVALRAGLLWVGEVQAQRAASGIKRTIRAQLAAHLLRLGPRYTATERGGTLIQVATEHVEALDEYVSQFWPAKQLAAIVPMLVVVAILILDPPTTLVLLFAGPILVLLLALIGQKTRILTERRFEDMRWMGAYFLDMLRGLPTLKLFGRSREQSDNIATIGERYGSTTMDVLRTAFQTSLVLEWGATAATALVAIEVSWRLLADTLPFDLALAVLLLTPEFFMPLRQLAQKYHAGTAGKTAAKEIVALLDTKGQLAVGSRQSAVQQDTDQLAVGSQQSAGGRDLLDCHLPPATCQLITFNNVRVIYRDNASPALDGCTLCIPHGKVTALVGPTGAGKSTVANLLLRFVTPDSGTISVDGVSIDSIDLAAWREQIAYVPQHPHLFAGTVADNIRLGRPDADMDAVRAAAQAAQAHAFICELPAGYATPLGEDGARLSGGQRQRIALARALLRNAPLLILDEATAHLDTINETAIAETLMTIAPGRTVVLIAHRLRIAYTADQIVLLDHGRVVATGDHETLLTTSAPYREMVERYEEGRLVGDA